MTGILGAWAHPLTRGMDVESPDAIRIHRAILRSKPLLRFVYDSWYREALPAEAATRHLALPMVELGSGAGHLEEVLWEVWKTDLLPHPGVHCAADAQVLPFRDGSLRLLYLLGVLHHLKEPGRFLSEAQRCLARGGRIVLVEPSGSPLHRCMVRRFHPHEGFDEHAEDWVNSGEGRMRGVNNALPWILFVRDRDRFRREFPD